MMTELEALKARHSVRRYLDKPIEGETLNLLRQRIALLNTEGGLHMQLITDEPRAFAGLHSYGKFHGVSYYIIVVGEKSDRLEYAAGYYGQQLVIYAQQLGLNTCWVGMTYKKVKEAWILGDNEKAVCAIAIGYGDGQGVAHKTKRPDKVSNIAANSPEWFAAGVDAALAAPTAINQQKFYFKYIGTVDSKGQVQAERGRSLVGYTRIDLGIAMCNFEIGAGRDNFTWTSVERLSFSERQVTPNVKR